MNYRVYLNDIELKVNNARVSAVPMNMIWNGEQRTLDQTEEAYFVSFDMSNPVKLSVDVGVDFDSYEIRPLSYDFNALRNGNRITLTIDRPMQFTVEIDGYHQALHVFANPLSQKPCGEMIYYGPGEHKADLIWLESNQTLYIDDGAVVYGMIYAKDAENIKIMGRGILDSSPYRRGGDVHEGGHEVIDALVKKKLSEKDICYHSQLVLHHCQNCVVEGIILRDAPFWSTIVRNNCKNIVLDNIKIIGQWRYNSDGIDICTSKNVIIKNSFIRSFDDGIVMRGAHLEGETGNVEEATVENCVIWCDWGKSLECWCGSKPTEIKNITFKNNYLIHLSVTAMNITVWFGSNHSVIDRVVYDGVEIDVDKDYLFCQIQTEENKCFEERWGFVPTVLSVSVEKLGKNSGNQQCEKLDDDSDFSVYFGNILYKNVKYFGAKQNLGVVIKKYSDIHTIENIIAENCDFKIEWGM